MINNRQNGRRRGRGGGGGGGQRQGGGGGQGPRDSGNRIDSRARGNANQLLEKYRNMARDAQMSGDRVQTEYYLQFADHYFRVLADQRGRFEERGEQQPRRQRDDFDSFDTFDGDDFEDEIEARNDDAAVTVQSDGRRDNGNGNGRDRDRSDDTGRSQRGTGSERVLRPVPVANDVDGNDEAPAEARRGRGRSRRPASEAGGNRAEPSADEQQGIADRLPPSFGFTVEGERATEGEPTDEAPRPRRRRARAAGGEAGPVN